MSLTNWKRILDHLGDKPRGIQKRPTLIGVHRTKKGQVAFTADVEGVPYEYQIQILRNKCWTQNGYLMLRCVNGRGSKNTCKAKMWLVFTTDGENKKEWLLKTNPNNENVEIH